MQLHRQVVLASSVFFLNVASVFTTFIETRLNVLSIHDNLAINRRASKEEKQEYRKYLRQPSSLIFIREFAPRRELINTTATTNFMPNSREFFSNALRNPLEGGGSQLEEEE